MQVRTDNFASYEATPEVKLQAASTSARLAVAVLLVVLSAPEGALYAQHPQVKPVKPEPPAAQAETIDPRISAIEQTILEKWERIKTLSAKVALTNRTASATHKASQVGGGTYEAKRRGDNLLLRMDLKQTLDVTTGTEKKTLTAHAITIVDGTTMYTLRDDGVSPPKAERNWINYADIIKLGGPRLIEEWHQYFTLKLDTPSNVNDRPTHVLSGTDKSGKSHITFHVDQEWGVMLKMVYNGLPDQEPDELMRILEITELRINQPIDDKQFVLVPPEGVEIVDLALELESEPGEYPAIRR